MMPTGFLSTVLRSMHSETVIAVALAWPKMLYAVHSSWKRRPELYTCGAKHFVPQNKSYVSSAFRRAVSPSQYADGLGVRT